MHNRVQTCSLIYNERIHCVDLPMSITNRNSNKIYSLTAYTQRETNIKYIFEENFRFYIAYVDTLFMVLMVNPSSVYGIFSRLTVPHERYRLFLLLFEHIAQPLHSANPIKDIYPLLLLWSPII